MQRFSLLFLLIAAFFKAQTGPFILNGFVVNEEGKPIQYAEIKISDQKFEYFVNTGTSGIFQKKIYNASQRLIISITKKGYEDYTQTMEVSSEKKYHFVLKRAAKEIEEVRIRNVGVVTKGDSTIYHANFYSNKKENRVIDLLKKLPGVDVDKNGGILVNGKKVSKVLVENETFFTGGSSLPINSLPANAVEKFEVLENYRETSALSSDEDNMVLNIKLKKEKKNIIFGDIFSHGNSKDRYKVGDNLFHYSPKAKAVLITNLNNINERTFSINDYISFNGGIERLLKDPAQFLNNINSKELMELVLPPEKYANKQFFNAANLTLTLWKNKFKISVFNITNDASTQELNVNLINFNNPLLAPFDRRENIKKENHTFSNTFNLDISRNKNENLDFFYNITLKKYKNDSREDKTISFLGRDNFYNARPVTENNHISQNLNLNYKLGKNNAQGIFISHFSSINQTSYFSSSDQKLFFLPIFNLNTGENAILQNNTRKNSQYKINFLHRLSFLTNHQFGLNVDYTFNIEKTGNAWIINDVSRDGLLNAFSLHKKLLSLGTSYLYKDERITFSASVDYLIYHNLFRSNINETDTQNNYLLPKAKFEFKDLSLGTFVARYGRDLKNFDSYYFYDGLYINSNSSLFHGIVNPENPLQENLALSYNKKSDYDGYNLYARYAYANYLKDYISDSQTNSFQRTTTVLFRKNIGHRNELDMRIEKSFLKNKLSVIANTIFSIERKNIILNNSDSESQTSSTSLMVTLKSRFKGNYNFEVFNTFLNNNFNNGISGVKFQTNETGVDFNLSIFEKMTIAPRFSFTKNLIDKSSYNYSSVKINYQKNSNFSLEFYLNNIFGSNGKTIVTGDEVFSYLQTVSLMPRFFYIGVDYKL